MVLRGLLLGRLYQGSDLVLDSLVVQTYSEGQQRRVKLAMVEYAPAKLSIFSFPNSVMKALDDCTICPLSIVFERRTVSCIYFWLNIESFPDHDGSVWVVLLHGGVCAREE